MRRRSCRKGERRTSENSSIDTRFACDTNPMPDKTSNSWEDSEAPWWAKLRRATQLIEVSEAYVAINSDSTVWTERAAHDDDQCWRYVFQMARSIPAVPCSMHIGSSHHS
jgi:hypothetical protein